ncbi:nitrogen fixation protein NifS [Helicobacter sp.]|uniref:nitrogen fixation protein NifS n=1 Tax=Helicobacter sp. TaxID=218 RepID=UPI0025899057|nr:nitrogen fixation protein NifS [Helicobacter sp.]MCI7766120.1 nitrogen fixation protein NifS [Helicobacter sp.]
MLDYLQNPPIYASLMQKLIAQDRPNYLAITPSAGQKISQENKELSHFLGCEITRPFSFNLESFYFLLSKLSQKYKVALVLSSHQMLYSAYLALPNKESIIPIIPDKKSGQIDIENALEKGADCFLIPYLNEDILTLNLHLDEILKDVFTLWDISYALALGLPLPKNANFLIANGENLGLMRPFGIMAGKDILDLGLYLEIENLYGVFLEAIRLQKVPKENQAQLFFEILKKELQEDCYCFFETSSNTLPLGLKGIKARNLIQSLIFDDISLINGQECLFGFAKPSFVLQLMGYSENQARELLSLSFKEKVDINRLAQKIIQKYRQIKSLQG